MAFPEWGSVGRWALYPPTLSRCVIVFVFSESMVVDDDDKKKKERKKRVQNRKERGSGMIHTIDSRQL